MKANDLISRYRSADSIPPMPALDGLNEVNWSAVEDAYGPANDLPALLRALVSDDPEHREFACVSLYQAIWHQGNVYSASAAAIPFLYKLLETEGLHDKETVAGLIGLIADGTPSFAHCESDMQAAAEWRAILGKSGESLEAKIAEGKLVTAEIQRQLAMRPDLLSQCMGSGPYDPNDE